MLVVKATQVTKQAAAVCQTEAEPPNATDAKPGRTSTTGLQSTDRVQMSKFLWEAGNKQSAKKMSATLRTHSATANGWQVHRKRDKILARSS